MANETSIQPGVPLTTFGVMDMTYVGQIIPIASGAGGTTRPIVGQAWPRGNVRGNT